MKKLLYFLILMTRVIEIKGQNMPKNKLSLQLGLNNNAMQDGAYSPLIYAGLGINVGLNYQKHREKSISNWTLDGGRATLKNKFQNTTEQYQVGLHYAYWHKLATTKHWFIGGISRTQIAVRRFDFAEDIGLEYYNGDVFSTFNAAVRCETDAQKCGKLTVELDIPIVGIAIARKIYSSNTHFDIPLSTNISNQLLKSAEIISFSKLKKISIHCQYHYTMSPKIAVLAAFWIDAYHFERFGNTTKVVNLTVQTGLVYLF